MHDELAAKADHRTLSEIKYELLHLINPAKPAFFVSVLRVNLVCRASHQLHSAQFIFQGFDLRILLSQLLVLVSYLLVFLC